MGNDDGASTSSDAATGLSRARPARRSVGLVLQIAKAQGFRTINLVRREEQVAEIQELGGDVVLCTADESWPEQLKAATGGNGIVSAIELRRRPHWGHACASFGPERMPARLWSLVVASSD